MAHIDPRDRLPRLRKIDTSRLHGQVRPRIRPRGVPPALVEHLVYSTHDVCEAESLGRELLGPHRLTVADDGGDFTATWHAVRFRDVTLGHLEYGTGVELVAAGLPERWLVLVPLNGIVEVTTPAGVAHASPIRAVTLGAGAMTLRAERLTSQLAVAVDQDALAVHLSRLLGHSLDHPLSFDLELDLAAPTSSRWNFAIQILYAELYDPASLLHGGVGLGQLEEFLMSALLYAHRSNYSDVLTAAAAPAVHRVTRAAKDFIQTHLSEPFRVADVAEAIGVSVRTLESAFHSDLHTTPTGFIHNCRLDRIRADLADAAPGATVTATAMRWGVSHLSRFATDYRTRFGENPSQTLRH